MELVENKGAFHICTNEYNKTSDEKVGGDQGEGEELLPGLVDLLPLLAPPHWEGDPAVGEQVEELVPAGELPEGGDVEAGVEDDEGEPVKGIGRQRRRLVWTRSRPCERLPNLFK